MSSTQTDSWRSDLKKWTTWAAASADDLADAGLRRLRRRIGRTGVPKIQPYMGYATVDTIRLHGRVLTNPPVDPDFNSDRWWDDLSNAVKRFASDEVPGIKVKGTALGASSSAISDAEGYFHLDIPRDVVAEDVLFWTPATLSIAGHHAVSEAASTTPSNVMYVPSNVQYGIISDVDDTILHTGATDIATMAKLTFFGNARTRAPLEGVAKLYELMQHAGDESAPPVNPIFYISSSPWNLYDLLEDFLELNAIPKGPLLLRDLGFDDNKFLKEGHDHKLDKARRLMRLFDSLPFVLIGDSGQEDARLYAAAAQEFGSRIRAILIRDIDPLADSQHDKKVARYIQQAAASGVPMHLVSDSSDAARLACQYGLLPEDVLPIIRDATERDKQRKRGVL